MKYEDADSVSPKPGGALGHGFDKYVHVLVESEFWRYFDAKNLTYQQKKKKKKERKISPPQSPGLPPPLSKFHSPEEKIIPFRVLGGEPKENL